MDFAFSDEQDMLRAAAREFLADAYGSERVAALADSDAGWDPSSWRRLDDIGWLDPDLSMVDLAVLFEEAGAALYPGPFFSTVALARPLAPTDRPTTLAWAEPGGPVRLADTDAVATTADDACRLTGRKVFVPDVATVERAFVTARGPRGVGVYAVDVAAHPETVVARSTMDRTRRLGELVLDGTPAQPVAEPPVRLETVREHALAALSCEAVGVAQRALDISAEHARSREQFGRPIGSYQAVSHRIANIYMALELARSLAYWAAWCVAEDDPQAPVACDAAKSAAAEAAVFACENAIQAMGGIGFTWDHPLHRYYKRAQWIDSFDTGGRGLRARIAATLLDPVG